MTAKTSASAFTPSEPLANVQAEEAIVPEPSTVHQRFGFFSHLNLDIPDSFFDPVPDEWTGAADDPDDPLNWSADRIAAANRASESKEQSRTPALF